MIEAIVVLSTIVIWLMRVKDFSQLIKTLVCCFLLSVVCLRMLRLATTSLLNRHYH